MYCSNFFLTCLSLLQQIKTSVILNEKITRLIYLSHMVDQSEFSSNWNSLRTVNYMSTWLVHGVQLFGQMLVQMLLWRYLYMWLIYNQLTFSKADYSPSVGGSHSISWRPEEQRLRFSKKEAILPQDCNMEMLPKFSACWHAL